MEAALFFFGLLALLPYGLPLAVAGGAFLAALAPGLEGLAAMALSGSLSLGEGDRGLVEALAQNWPWALLGWGGLALLLGRRAK